MRTLFKAFIIIPAVIALVAFIGFYIALVIAGFNKGEPVASLVLILGTMAFIGLFGLAWTDGLDDDWFDETYLYERPTMPGSDDE